MPTICVTGAGGSIGSALVNTLARDSSNTLLLIESSENALFEISRRIEVRYPRACCEPVLGNAGDGQLLDDIFSRLRPDTIFHAAAFKHVGLMEQHPFAAIANNVLGSYTLFQAAERHGVAKLLFVSTDKAAYPCSVMGVSKRIGELLVLSMSGPFAANAIRLGNVIGSAGSVVPLFLRQLDEGVPLSVTHPEAARYFLSMEQAVAAILAAAAAGCEGKVLLPAFGEPVRIAELAEFLGQGLPIRFTGLRPGEKISEDLIGPDEEAAGTVAGPLTVVNSPLLSRDDCEEAIRRLSDCIERRDTASLLETLAWLVPEYKPSRWLEDRAAAGSLESR